MDDVFTVRHGGKKSNIRCGEAGLFKHDHSVRAIRNGRAGEDLDRGAFCARQRGNGAGGNFFQNPQGHGRAFRSARGVAAAEGKAVIGGFIKGGDIFRGAHILGQHSSGGIPKGNALSRYRLRRLQQQLPRGDIVRFIQHSFHSFGSVVASV